MSSALHHPARYVSSISGAKSGSAVCIIPKCRMVGRRDGSDAHSHDLSDALHISMHFAPLRGLHKAARKPLFRVFFISSVLFSILVSHHGVSLDSTKDELLENPSTQVHQAYTSSSFSMSIILSSCIPLAISSSTPSIFFPSTLL